MLINKLKLMRSLLFGVLLSSLASSTCLSCATVRLQDGAVVTAAGKISQGGLVVHMISTATCTLTANELIDMIDAQPSDRTCVPACGLPVCAEDQSTGTPMTVPARGASIIMTSADWGEKKTELDLACRELGNRCSIAIAAFIRGMMKVAP